MPLSPSNIKQTTSYIKVVSYIPIHGEVNSIQLFMMKLLCDLQQVNVFLQLQPFPPPIKQSAML
jgi:hypothetical protein